MLNIFSPEKREGMARYSFKKMQREKKVKKFVNNLKKFHWKYKNLIFLTASIIIAYFLLQSPQFNDIIAGLEGFGYIGVFVAGMLFSYGMTAAPASTALYMFSKNLDIFLVAVIGGTGAVVSDYLIFRFVRHKLLDEIKLLSEEINNRSKPISNLLMSEQIRINIWKRISRSRIWKRLIPVIAGLIIASPLPDELGAALFGATKYDSRKFVLLSYLLNLSGIFAIAILAKVI